MSVRLELKVQGSQPWCGRNVEEAHILVKEAGKRRRIIRIALLTGELAPLLVFKQASDRKLFLLIVIGLAMCDRTELLAGEFFLHGELLAAVETIQLGHYRLA